MWLKSLHNELSLLQKKLKLQQNYTKKKSVFAFDPRYHWNYFYQNSAHVFILLTTRMTDKQLRNDTNILGTGKWISLLLAATCRWSQLAWDSVTVSVSAQQWRPEAKAAKAGETSRTVAVRPSGSTLRYMGQNAFSLVIIALCPTSNNTVKLYSEKGATSSKSLYGDCTKPSCKEGPFRHERRNSAYCDREGREFQETHQLQTLRVCSSRVYKKIQILDSSTSSVKVYTKMYSIYTAARTTPSSQMLLYSSLCTKRKKTGSAVALHGG